MPVVFFWEPFKQVKVEDDIKQLDLQSRYVNEILISFIDYR